MVQFLSPLSTDAEFQWDVDSIQKGVNCGPSAAEKVANFYKNLYTYGIEKTRKLGTSRIGTGTNTIEQRRMLEYRGVPASVRQLTAAQIKEILKTTRQPFILWLKMGWIPRRYRLHDFEGMHSVTAMANGLVDGQVGIWYMDPNFHRDRILHPFKVFVPEVYWAKAYLEAGRWCIVPDAAKVIPTRNPLRKKWFVQFDGVRIRSGPSTATKALSHFDRGEVFTSNKIETAGGKYRAPNGEIKDNWLGLIWHNKQCWVAKAFTREA